MSIQHNTNKPAFNEKFMLNNKFTASHEFAYQVKFVLNLIKSAVNKLICSNSDPQDTRLYLMFVQNHFRFVSM